MTWHFLWQRSLDEGGGLVVAATGGFTLLVGFALGLRVGSARRRSDRFRPAHRATPEPSPWAAPPEANPLDTQFLDILAHELRTPLSGILGAADLLQQGLVGPMSDDQRYFLEKIVRLADGMHGLLNDLIDMRRAHLGKLHLIPGRVPPSPFIEETLSDLAPLAARASLRLVSRVPPDLPAIWGDPARLRQVLVNLLSNAIKFTPASGTIEVRAWEEGAHVRIEVRDSGIGIAKQDHATIFARFWQPEAGNEKGGLGLGLTLCKALVEAHGGSIEVRSELGKGSAFTISLPREAARQPHAGSRAR
jgi:signal transduction histidine kinase